MYTGTAVPRLALCFSFSQGTSHDWRSLCALRPGARNIFALTLTTGKIGAINWKKQKLFFIEG